MRNRIALVTMLVELSTFGGVALFMIAGLTSLTAITSA